MGSLLKSIEVLKQYTEHRVKLIGVYDNGAAIAKGDDYRTAFTSDVNEISALMSGNGDKEGRAKGKYIKLFRFIPKEAGLLIIDIDRGHDDGIDGLEVFYSFFESVNVYRCGMPQALQNIEDGSFPCYVLTPSGGYHLVFKYNGDAKLKLNLDGKGVDILYTKAATAAGSVKVNGTYTLHGLLDHAPHLYPFIEKRIMQPERVLTSMQSTTGMRMQRRNEYKPFTGMTTWEKIIEFTNIDGRGEGGRNERAYSIALHARTHGWTKEDTLNKLLTEPSISGLPKNEVISTVNSAYRRTR